MAEQDTPIPVLPLVIVAGDADGWCDPRTGVCATPADEPAAAVRPGDEPEQPPVTHPS